MKIRIRPCFRVRQAGLDASSPGAAAMFRIPLGRRALTAAALLALGSPAAASTTLTDQQAEQGRQLVKQLGAKEFRAREAAKNKLIRMGSAVEPILRQGMGDADPEIRFRSRT